MRRTKIAPMSKSTQRHFTYCPSLVGTATVRPDNRLESGITVD
jgi:hypothetical protein